MYGHAITPVCSPRQKKLFKISHGSNIVIGRSITNFIALQATTGLGGGGRVSRTRYSSTYREMPSILPTFRWLFAEKQLRLWSNYLLTLLLNEKSNKCYIRTYFTSKRELSDCPRPLFNFKKFLLCFGNLFLDPVNFFDPISGFAFWVN